MHRVVSGLVAGILLLFQGTPAAPRDLPRPDHVVIVIEENKGYDDIIGSSSAPYLNSLVEHGALLTNSTPCITQPAELYGVLFRERSGNLQRPLSQGRFTKPSLGGSLLRAS